MVTFESGPVALPPSTLEVRVTPERRPVLAAVTCADTIWVKHQPLPAHVLVRDDGSAVFTAEGEKLRGLLDALDADPAGAAKEIGKACGRCMWCHQALTQASSQQAGVGPVCVRKYGARIAIGQRGARVPVANLDMRAAAEVAAAVRGPTGEVLELTAALVDASPLLRGMLADLADESGEGVPQLLLDAAPFDADLLAQLHAFVTASVPPPRTADAALALDFLGAQAHLHALCDRIAMSVSASDPL